MLEWVCQESPGLALGGQISHVCNMTHLTDLCRSLQMQSEQMHVVLKKAVIYQSGSVI